MIHLLVGPDRYLVHEELGRILGGLDPEGLNTTRFDSSAPISDVANAVATAAFFGDGRVIVAEGVMERSRPNGKGRRVEKSDLESLFTSVAPGNTLILIDPNLETVPKTIRDAAGKDANQFGGRVSRGSELIEWVQLYVTGSGGRVERRVAQRLLERLFPVSWREANRNPTFDFPPDLQRLSSELDKLATAADGEEISARLVDDLAPQSAGEEFFPLTDAIVFGRAAQALAKLAAYGADDADAARIFNELASSAELGQIVSADADSPAVRKELGASDGRWAAVRTRFSRGGAESLAYEILTAERRMKTGFTRSPMEQLHEVIMRRARKTRDR